ncbi:MAG: DUF3052 family protein [Kofleriaceae bacterium]|nr:DUF3052 family protein [Kofleriaceae bacterium]
MAGYAGKPLPKKLGIKAGHKVCLLNAPGALARDLSSEDVRIAYDLRLPPVDVVVLFVDRVADLERRFADITARMHPAGGFWVAWPKARRGCDITEEVVRRIALACGMTDNKVCSMGDHVALRLVLRAEHREAIMYRVEPPPPISRRVRRPTAAARVMHRQTSGAGSTLRRARARSTK